MDAREATQLIDTGAEQSLLGTLIANPDRLSHLPEKFSPDHYADPGHTEIHRALATLALSGTPSVPTLKNALRGSINGIDPTYLAKLIGAMISGHMVPDHARVITDLWRRREMVRVAEELRHAACNIGYEIPPADALAGAINALGVLCSALPSTAGLGLWDAGADDYVIPPREWLLGNIFCRRYFSSILADGGVGKTALRVAQLMSLAIGRSLTGEHVFQRCRVLILSLEDDRDELRRRVNAVMRHHGITQEQMRGWLYLAAPKGLKLAKMVDGSPQTAELEDLLRRAITDHRLDIVSLDPFVKSHELSENDNMAIDYVSTILTKLAIEYNCAVDAPHHTKKGLDVAGDADAGRGGGAMKNAARLVYTLTRMSKEEAATFGISETERRSLVRTDSGKVNIAPQSADAKWFRIIGVPLHNCTEMYPNGDEVQTVEPWQSPSTWEALDGVLLNQILDDIEAGLPSGSRYSDASAAGDRGAWMVVTRHAPDKTEKQAREVIKAWMKTGTLYTEEYEDPDQRKKRKGLRVNATKRPT